MNEITLKLEVGFESSCLAWVLNSWVIDSRVCIQKLRDANVSGTANVELLEKIITAVEQVSNRLDKTLTEH
jgi:hypothetical protein